MAEFKKGEKISLMGGKTAVIEEILGQGGQGIVYQVKMDRKQYALKWYLPEYLKHIDQRKFYQNLKDNYLAGPPSDQFLWMKEISEYSENSFGYLMELRPKRYSSFTDILNAKKRIGSLNVQFTAAQNVCRAFQTLHRNGYSYQDINDGNFFIDVANGDVLICDNDNVAPYGEWMGMGGKDRYMAPEVVLGKKHAGMESDLFSLSVVLFMLFFISHPLDGRNVHACPCLTTKFIRKFYAESPVFVFDPKNPINRPEKGIDNNVLTLWPLYPEKLRNIFTRAFTEGLSDSSYRVRENEWINCLEEIKDTIIKCPKCGGEQFYRFIKDGSQFFKCEDCSSDINKPIIWDNGLKKKLIYIGQVVEEDSPYDIGKKEIIGTVVESKKNPGLWGIKNETGETWTAELRNGRTLTIQNGQPLPLFDGTKVRMFNKSITITI